MSRRVARDLDRTSRHVRRADDVASADEARHERRVGTLVDVFGRSDLLDAPGVHDDDAIGHGHRLDLIVRDIDRRVVEFVVQPADFEAHVAAQIGVEIGQWLIQQQNVGLRRQRPRERDPLLLAAGQFGGIALGLRPKLRRVEQRRRCGIAAPAAASISS